MIQMRVFWAGISGIFFSKNVNKADRALLANIELSLIIRPSKTTPTVKFFLNINKSLIPNLRVF